MYMCFESFNKNGILLFCNLLVQHASLSPNGKLLAIVGDNPEGLLVDPNTGKVHICGHGHKRMKMVCHHAYAL